MTIARLHRVLRASDLLFAATLVAAFLPFAWQDRPDWRFAAVPAPPMAADDVPELTRMNVASAPSGRMVHAATLAILPDGTLLAAWYGGSAEAAPDVALYTARLAPGAVAWSTPALLLDRAAAMRGLGRWIGILGNPLLAPLPDGRLALVFVSSFSGWSTSRLAAMISVDGGVTWSPPRLLAASPFFNTGTLVRDRPVAYADGTIGLPAYSEALGLDLPLLLRLDPDRGVVDRRPLGGTAAALQPSLAVLDGTRALALLRDPDPARRRVLLARTGDGGRSWTAAVPTALDNPDSAVAALPAGGRILAVFNPAPDNRRSLWVAESLDEGAHWRLVRPLDAVAEGGPEDGPAEVSYPAVAMGPDGRIHVLYTWRRDAIRHVAVNADWLDGR